MIGHAQLAQIHDATVYDSAGDKIGGVKQVFVDDASGEPVVASVHTGLFGMSESFVPIHDGELDKGRLRVTVDKAKVRDAPRLEPAGKDEDVHLSDSQLQELYRYYNLPYGGGRRDYGRTDVQDTPRPMAGQNPPRTSGGESAGGQRSAAQRSAAEGSPMSAAMPGSPTTGTRTPRVKLAPTPNVKPGPVPGTKSGTQRPGADGGSPEVVRYEERMHVGTERVESGRVRLRKHVVTENVTKSVPLRHEEVRVERVPVDETTADPRHKFADETVEETLYTERPVVETEAVPVEKVRLAKETRTTEEQVTGEVRREEIDLDDTGTRRKRDR